MLFVVAMMAFAFLACGAGPAPVLAEPNVRAAATSGPLADATAEAAFADGADAPRSDLTARAGDAEAGAPEEAVSPHGRDASPEPHARSGKSDLSPDAPPGTLPDTVPDALPDALPDAPPEAPGAVRTLAPGREGFRRSAPGELTRTVTRPDGHQTMREYTNAPWPFRAGAPTEVIVYLTPNGNTLEQTLGRRRNDGESFRYDIQHVLAQVRAYRMLVPEHNVVLRVLEAPQLSWPTWVRSHHDVGPRVRHLLLTPPGFAPRASLVLAAHSGGGSAIFALLEHVSALPSNVTKIALLDSNYAFDVKLGHAKKLTAWLRNSPSRRLLSVAYDDRNILLNGKRVVPDDGGSFRATLRMVDAFRASGFTLTESMYREQQRYRSPDGARGVIDLFVHPNPHNRILHSGLVSDENGLLFALGHGQGATVEAKTPYHGPRAYTRFIDPAP